MELQDQSPALRWQDTPLGAVPVALRFGDPYFSLDGGLTETHHVFHQGNRLPQRFCDGFSIAELGFGTGLNLLATVVLWAQSVQAGRFRYTSFEAYPLSAEQTAQALAPFDTLKPWAEALVTALAAGHRQFPLGAADVTLMIGDAGDTLPLWQGRADAWFLDGFSPALNPDLWSAGLMVEVARHTRPGGSFATYTAAGQVRRDLQAAGFQVERVQGYGRKRHMSRGTLPPAAANPEPVGE